MKRRHLIPLTFLLLAPALVADAAKVKDIPVQEGDFITATSGGKKFKKHTAKITVCGKKASGKYFVAKCTDACTSKFWRWRFWVTRYNVSRTFFQGEHQGIRIHGAEYKFDKRFPAKDGMKQPWKPGNSNPFMERILDPDNEDVSKSAMCNAVKIVLRTKINNHGRTLALATSAAWLNRNIKGLPIKILAEHSIGPLDYPKWSDPSGSYSKESAEITQCLDNIHDGYCDYVCGNCSYVLPPLDMTKPAHAALDSSGQKIKGFAAQVSVVPPAVEGTGGSTVIYTKNPIVYKLKVLGGTIRKLDDDFTHCVNPTSTKDQQRLMFVATRANGVITGLWGHNSNTDAEAEFRQFKACIKDPSVSKSNSCGACGKDRSNPGAQRKVQFPCVNSTNEAKETWSETTKESLQIPKVYDSGLGGLSKAPMCVGRGFMVNGM